MRQSLSGSFTSSKMKFIFELLNKSCSQFAEHYSSANGPTEVDMNEVSAMYVIKKVIILVHPSEILSFSRLTTDSIASSAYGIEVNSFKDPDNVFFLMSKNILDLTTLRSQLKVLLTTICPVLLRVCKNTIQICKQNQSTHFSRFLK